MERRPEKYFAGHRDDLIFSMSHAEWYRFIVNSDVFFEKGIMVK